MEHLEVFVLFIIIHSTKLHTHTMCWLISEMEAGIFSIFIQCAAPDVVSFVSKSKSWKGTEAIYIS